MSILSPSTQQQKTEAEESRDRLIQSVQQLVQSVVVQWRRSYSILWEGSDPAAVLELLGEDAAELFALNTALVTFMLSELSGKRDDLAQEISDLVAAIPAHTVHQDGTVTLDLVD